MVASARPLTNTTGCVGTRWSNPDWHRLGGVHAVSRVAEHERCTHAKALKNCPGHPEGVPSYIFFSRIILGELLYSMCFLYLGSVLGDIFVFALSVQVQANL